jgi:hypothetical protein
MHESVLAPAGTELLLRTAAQALEIGFDWLCFSAVSKREERHNPLFGKMLRSFGPLEIGFVFSNSSSHLDAVR